MSKRIGVLLVLLIASLVISGFSFGKDEKPKVIPLEFTPMEKGYLNALNAENSFGCHVSIPAEPGLNLRLYYDYYEGGKLVGGAGDGVSFLGELNGRIDGKVLFSFVNVPDPKDGKFMLVEAFFRKQDISDLVVGFTSSTVVLKKPDYKSIHSIKGITGVETLELGVPKIVGALAMDKDKTYVSGDARNIALLLENDYVYIFYIELVKKTLSHP